MQYWKNSSYPGIDAQQTLGCRDRLHYFGHTDYYIAQDILFHRKLPSALMHRMYTAFHHECRYMYNYLDMSHCRNLHNISPNMIPRTRVRVPVEMHVFHISSIVYDAHTKVLSLQPPLQFSGQQPSPSNPFLQVQDPSLLQVPLIQLIEQVKLQKSP